MVAVGGWGRGCTLACIILPWQLAGSKRVGRVLRTFILRALFVVAIYLEPKLRDSIIALLKLARPYLKCMRVDGGFIYETLGEKLGYAVGAEALIIHAKI